ncbi:retrovirus-related pol polyprotein from transposon TNT 1-94 [Tanacetum coccineum]|uniref:Retrovirus-related pol polyprotein from transposon TNT 1-94 n=1 Tax=Tanacetum coccineum TaxID=301880 RepID=A0ABQ5HSU2_9ASTR
MSVFEVRSSDEELIPANDRFSKADGYHAVPPPITGNFLTLRADISFAGFDEYAIRKKLIKSKTTELNADTGKSKTSETVGNTNEVNVKKPKYVNESVVSTPNINKDKVIIEDWNSDDENDVSEVSPVKTNETQTAKTQVDKIGQTSKKAGIGFKKIKACFDNAKRVNHQKISNKLNYPQARRTFVPSGVLTRTGLVNPVRPNEKRAVQTINTARPVSTARSVSTARPFAPKTAQTSSVVRPIYPRMDNVRPRASSSQIRRSYYTKPAFRPKNLKQDVKTSGVKNMTTAGTRAVVNTGKGKMNNDLKKSRWVWRPKGNYIDLESKEKGSFILKKFKYGNLEICLQDYAVVDSGCSSHMTGNKAYLSDYEDYNGGFVMEALWLLEVIPKEKNSVLFTDTKCLILSPSFKLLDESQVVLRAPRQNGVYSLDLKNIVLSGGSRDRPPMLATGRYAQWRSRFLRYIDTRPNGDALRKCILKGPYTPTIVTTPVVPATEDSPAVPEQTTVETVTNMTPENRAHFESEKEAIHLILTGIGDEIYSTVDACQTTQEMWEAIERLQQGESLNIQDVKTNLFWEFGQFTSHDGETIESYYTRFYKMMNEMIRNNLTVATMQVNVQFLQQLQPEWSRFVTIVKQQHKLDEVSYHKLFDILKQYQKEVNELRAERMAKNANPLALVATAQTLQDPYYQTSKPHKSYAPTSKASLPTRSHATTRYKGKEIAKPITPPSESASEEDSDPEQAQKDKDMQKNLALIAKWSSSANSFGIQCINARNLVKSKECRKPKRLETPRITRKRLLLCKQAEESLHGQKIQEVPMQTAELDSEPLETVETDDSNVTPDSPDMCDNDIQDDQNDVECDDERVALANLIANLKLDTEFERYKAFNDRTVDYDKLEHKLNEALGLIAQKEIDIKEGLKVKAYEISVVKEKHDELVKQSLLTKSHYEGLVKEKTKPVPLKTQNDSFAFVHELKQEMHADLKYVESLEDELDELESDKAEFSNMYDMLLQECVSKDVMCSYLQSSSDLDEITELQCLYLHKVRECDCLAQKLSEQTEFFDKPSVVRQPNAQRIPKPSVLGKPAPFSDSLERKNFAKKKSVSKTNESEGLSKPVTPQNLPQTATQAVRVAHKTNVSRPQPRSNQMKDKVVPNTSHVKFKKTEVEEHPRISSISNQTKSVTAFSKFLKDVNARTKKPNVVPISTRKPKSQANKSVATPHKKIVASESTITNSKSYYRMLYKKTNKAWKWWIAQQCPSAYTWVPKTKRKWVPKVRNESVTKKIVQLILFIVDSGCTKHMTGNLSLLCNFVEKYLGTVRFGNDQFAPILGHGDLVQGNITIKRVYYVEEIASGNDLLTGNRGTDLYTISLQETTSSTPICLMAKASPTQAWLWHRRLSHLNFDYINLLSKKDVVIGLPKLKYVKDQLCSSCEVSKAKRSSFKSKTVPSSKGRLNLLHMDLCGPMRVASINGKKYILVIVDDYSRYTWTLFLRSKDETPEVLKDFLTMIQRNLQAPVISVRTDRGTEFLNKTLHAFFKEEGIEHQTSTPRTWNRTILEAMADSAWIEAMQEELHQFDRLQVWELVDKPFGKNEECIDFEEPIAPDASLEAVRILSAYPAPQRRFYVAQPDGFHDPDHQTKFYRLQETSLYGLKQAPRAWYDELSKFLISKGFTKGIIDPTLFTIKYGEDILLVQIYVDDIIFGSTNPKFSKRFEKLMHGRFEMSLMGEMKFFLGLQIHQSPRGIFINQAKYTLEILKKHGMEKGQSIGTPMATKPKLDADLSGEPVDQTDYRSKIGSLMYLTSSRPDIVQAVCTIHMGHFIAGNRMGFCIELTADFRCGRSLADALILYSQKHFLEEYKFPKSDKLVIDVQEVRCYCMVIHRGEYMAIICNLCSVKCGYCGHKAFKIMASTTTKIKKNGCE